MNWRLKLGVASLIGLVTAIAVTPQASAQQNDNSGEAARYSLCMDKARNSPKEAESMARGWLDQNGGSAAGHCLAVSLISQGKFVEAAQRLEVIAHSLGEEHADLRTDLLAQAGQSWILAKNLEKALAAQNRGLELDKDNVELLVDRGLTHASLNDYWSALDDFNAAFDLAPERPDILTYRATAYRYLDVPDLALDNLNRALGIDPDFPEALLERGILRHAAGNEEGARQDWREAARVAPESMAGQAAQANLRRLMNE